MRSRSWKAVLVLAIVVLSSLSAVVPVSAGPGNSVVVPVNAVFAGKTYAQWSVAWWTWAFTTDANAGPFGAGTVDCTVGQTEPGVLFLAGPFNSSGTIDRTCAGTIPAGTGIFLPVVNVECSNIEADPFFGATAQARRACAEAFRLIALHARVDGQPVTSLQAFTVTSADSPFTGVVPGNAAGLAHANPNVSPPWSGRFVSSGIWLMLLLPAGDHTIQFGGKFPLFKYTLDVTYHVTVS
jgi:hypothetical protein